MANFSENRESTSAIDSKRVRFARSVSVSTVIAILIIAFCVLMALLVAISESDEAPVSIDAGIATIGGGWTASATSVATESVKPNSVGKDGTEGNELSTPVSKDIPVDVEAAVATAKAEPSEEQSKVAGDTVARRETAEQKPFLITPLSASGASSPWRAPNGTDARNFSQEEMLTHEKHWSSPEAEASKVKRPLSSV